jgi:HEAT repeat protein
MKHAALLCFLLAALPAQQQPAAKGGPTPADLVRQLLEPDRRRAAAVALLRLGEPAATAIAAMLEDARLPAEGEGLVAREWAVDVLYHLGPDALPALDALVACFARKDHQSLRSRILQAIGHCAPWRPERAEAAAKQIGKDTGDDMLGMEHFFATLSRLQFDASAETQALVAGLEHKNGYVRELAAEAIERTVRGGITAADRPALIAALQRAMQDEHPANFDLKWEWHGRPATTRGGCDNKESMQVALSRALLALDPMRPETVAGHRDLLKHLDPRVRQEAARSLGLLGAQAADAAGPLVLCLDDPEPAVAREAATALGLLGSGIEIVRQGLERASGSSDKQLAARAKAALLQLERKNH